MEMKVLDTLNQSQLNLYIDFAVLEAHPMTGSKGTPSPTRVDEPSVHVMLGHPLIELQRAKPRGFSAKSSAYLAGCHTSETQVDERDTFQGAIKGAPKQAEKVAVGSDTPIWPTFSEARKAQPQFQPPWRCSQR